MALEPPDGYVAFVAQHLTWLRDETARAVGDEHDGDLLYPEVLSDVARWWRWLELRRDVLRQRGAADEYLHRALLRRVRRWDAERIWATPDDMWAGEIHVWRREEERPYWSSAAVRLAPHLRPTTTRTEVGPVAEAAIAWWHAYEAGRRHRLIALLVVTLVLVALLMRVAATGE
jgi:hypothetical protein